ncbi:MAG: O-antigen ligase family protein [Kosmotogaceae bacterium]
MVKEKKLNLNFETIIYLAMILVIPLFIVRGFTHEPSTGKHLIYTFGFAVLLIIGLLKKRENSLRIYYNKVHIAALGFGVAAILSIFPLLQDNPHYFRYTLDIAIYALIVVITGIYISNTFKTRPKIELAMLFFVITAAIVSFNGLLNYYIGYDLFMGKTGDSLTRAAMRSTIGNPNFVSDYMGLTIPMVIYFLVNPKPLKELFKSKLSVTILKSVLLAFLVPMLAAIFVAETRTVMVGILVGNLLFIVFYLLLSRKIESFKKDDFVRIGKIFVVLALILVVVTSYLYLTPTPVSGGGQINVTSRIGSAISSSRSWNERFSAWKNSIYQWVDDSNRMHLVFGTGIGTFQLYHLLYSPDVLQSNPGYMTVWNNFKRTHNDYLQVLGETGLIGFIFIILFMLFLVIRYFRVIFKLHNRIDLLMYGALGAGIFSLTVHTLFEFPLHMQPNLMAGVFIIAIATGSYFNKDLKPINIKRSILLIVFLVLFIPSIFLKFTAYLGEGYFRKAQEAQQYYYAYYQESMKVDSDQIKQLQSNLENFEGQFDYLKNLTNYMAAKGQTLKQKYSNLSERDFIAAAEKERQEEIQEISEKLENNLKQYNYLLEKSEEYFNDAVTLFKTSTAVNPVFGKPLWYLGGLGTKPQILNRNLTSDEIINILTADDKQSNFTSFIQKEFDGNLEIVPLPEKSVRTAPYNEFINENRETIDEQIINVLYLRYLAQIQMLQNAVDYYESSMIHFSERQTPRLVGRIFSSITPKIDQYISYLNQRKSAIEQQFDKFEQFLVVTKSYREYCKEQALYWYDLGITLLPGSWNRYNDWKDVYKEYMQSIVQVVKQTEEKAMLILDVAQKHVWAVKGMAEGNIIGVPLDTLTYCYDFANSSYSDSLPRRTEFLGQVIDIYRPAYLLMVESLQAYQGKDIANDMKAFISKYEEIETELKK